MTVATDDSRAKTAGYALSLACATLILFFSLVWHLWLRRPGSRNEDARGVAIAAQANLEYCSVDVFLEIASHLDCEDILRLRQVSKRIDTMSRLRALWEPMAVKNASMLLKKRVDVCTAQELEHAVAQYRKAKTEILSATRCIKKGAVFHGKYTPFTVLLAPGGRWLLNNTEAFKYGVVYVDLDDPDPRWRQLIPPYSGEAMSTWMSLDSAYNGSNPSFHFALETLVSVPRAPDVYPYGRQPLDRTISVWKASPTFDRNGVIDGLTAEQKFLHRISFAAGDYRTLDLQGPYLLFSHYSTCSIIKWVDVELGTEDFPRKTISFPGCAYAHFLTERWLLVGDMNIGQVAIFDISLVPITRGHNVPSASIIHRWTKTIDCAGPPFPPARVVGNSVHQILSSTNGICLLELDLSSDTTPPRITFVDKQRSHCGPRSRCFSRDTFAYLDDISRKPFVYVFDTKPQVMANDFPQVFQIAAPFIRPMEFISVILDAYSTRLVLRGSDDRHYICSFVKRPLDGGVQSL